MHIHGLHIGLAHIGEAFDVLRAQIVCQMAAPHIEILRAQVGEHLLESRQRSVVEMGRIGGRRGAAAGAETLHEVVEAQVFPEPFASLSRHAVLLVQQVFGEGGEGGRLAVLIDIGIEFDSVAVAQPVIVGPASFAVRGVAGAAVVHLRHGIGGGTQGLVGALFLTEQMDADDHRAVAFPLVVVAAADARTEETG